MANAQIQILDADTINQIAAGEVVERPASVVKELVENAIDAHATAISVEIKDGGIQLIRITDNGDGIESRQVPTAFARHATSKIRTVEDLLSVGSLGFRGEALSSIAAVARVEIFTKTAEELMGTHYVIEGGQEKLTESVGMTDGTTFVVRNLFYNTPARRKFLNTPMSEGGRVQELMQQMALSHPEISFKFVNQNQVRLQTSGRHTLKEIIYEIYGKNITRELLEMEVKQERFQMTGWIGKPVIGRGNRNFEHYFINGRAIKSKIVSKAIEDAYQGFLMQHKYPFVVLHIVMPGEGMDVNVHPTKMELRFQDNEEVYRQIFDGIRKRLKQEEFIHETSPGEEVFLKQEQKCDKQPKTESFKDQKPSSEQPEAESLKDQKPSNEQPETNRGASVVAESREAFDVFAKAISGGKAAPEPFESKRLLQYQTAASRQLEMEEQRQQKIKQESGEQLRLFSDNESPKEFREAIRLVGQVFDTYWIVEQGDKIFFVDQHAAHEKIIYERMVAQLEEKQMTSQQMSPPLILTLTPAEEEKLQLFLPYFEMLGYQITSFGGKEYAIGAVPGDLYGLVEKTVFLELLDELDVNTGRYAKGVILEKLASMSCKAAVKGGMRLSFPEAQKMMEELLALENPYHCPHGRPVILAMTKRELEKKFKRIV